MRMGDHKKEKKGLPPKPPLLPKPKFIPPNTRISEESKNGSFKNSTVDSSKEDNSEADSSLSFIEIGNDSKIENVTSDNKAYLIAKELMTSEQVYIDALKLIVFDFKNYINECNARNNAVIIPNNELEKIFTTLPQLLHLNEDLLNDLVVRIDQWNEGKGLAEVIVRKGPFLKLYTTYMRDFENQCNYMDECCIKYPKFANALKEYENSPICKKLTLKHYMLKPIQRIPHYRLLLEDYLKHLNKESLEYRDTETALNIIRGVLHHANSSLKLVDNFYKLYQIQTALGNNEIIKPGRLFIKEGELKKLSRKETQARFIILLSDCLLYTIYTTSVTGLKLKYELPLSGMKVQTHNDTQGDFKEFSIITNTRSFTLRAKNSIEGEEWVNALTTAIKENNSRQLSFLNKTCNVGTENFDSLKLGRQAPIWIQDKSTTMCQICTAEFTVTFRRHHCRCCGKVVCGDCSNNRAPLLYLKFQSARVCEECFNYLLKEFEDPLNKMNELIKQELKISDEEAENLRASFKKMDIVKKVKKFVPQRLKEVMANDSGSSMSGWLCRKHKKDWKRMWFVLKDQVLYMYKASHDVVAHDSLPVLGYTVERQVEVEDMDCNLVFRLTHAGQTPVVFSAPNKQVADMWINALTEASVLK